MRTPDSHKPNDRKLETVITDLRGRIVAGKWGPGEQLPTWDALEKEYGIARTTLRGVMSRLRDDGFLHSESTRGVFVAQHPPHLSRYALVFDRVPRTRGWIQFYDTLASQAAVLQGALGKEIEIFYGVTPKPESEARQTLFRQILSERFAGVVFVAGDGTSELINATPASMPKVMIAALAGRNPNIPTIGIEDGSFLVRALDDLAARNCKKVAVLNADAVHNDKWTKAIQERGMQTMPLWLQSGFVERPNGARNMMALLMSLDKKLLPEGLIITDDNLVPPAIAGLVDVGVRLDKDLQVIAHCNWPLSDSQSLPIRRLGFDISELLSQALSSIDTLRRGCTVPPHQLISAIFEEELKSSVIEA